MKRAKQLLLGALHHSGLLHVARRLNRRHFLGCRVLNFHRVLPNGAPPDAYAALMGEPTAEQFERLLSYLQRSFYLTTPRECVERWKAGAEVQPYSLILSFDDGYADLHENLLPIAERRRAPVSVFLATGAVDGRRLWFQRLFSALVHTERRELAGFRFLPTLPLHDTEQRVGAIEAIAAHKKGFSAPDWEAFIDELGAELGVTDPRPGEEMMTWTQAADLHASPWISLGSHTVTHALLTQCDASSARRELVESAEALRSRFELPFLALAYPNGNHSPEIAALAAEVGYDCAFTMRTGVNTSATPLQMLCRQSLAHPESVPHSAYALSGIRAKLNTAPPPTRESGAAAAAPLSDPHPVA
jgi:peptidoglycan/xylan/chitin deacetylase (PgdA/CDA1 family)